MSRMFSFLRFAACAKRRIVRGFICLPAKCGCSCVWFRGLVTIVCDTSRNFVNNSVNGGLTKKIGNQNSEAADDNLRPWLFAIIAVSFLFYSFHEDVDSLPRQTIVCLSLGSIIFLSLSEFFCVQIINVHFLSFFCKFLHWCFLKICLPSNCTQPLFLDWFFCICMQSFNGLQLWRRFWYQWIWDWRVRRETIWTVKGWEIQG